MPDASPICLVTGAAGGLGMAVADGLARRHATVVMLCRDAARGERARAKVSAASGNSRVNLILADLASPASIRVAADEIKTTYPRLDVLINAAAVFTRRRRTTADGLEFMFATNHLGPFLLTVLLLEPLRASDGGRILTITAPSTVPVDFTDLQSERRFSALRAFGATKMCNLLFTYELARRLDRTSVMANAVHPGVFRSALMREAPAPIGWLTYLFGAPAERAAAPLVRFALEERYRRQNGKFFHRDRELQSNDFSRDPSNQRRLWEFSEQLLGEAG